MSKEMSVILLGVAVAIIPYLGIPSSWRTLLFVLAGLTLVIIGFLLRSRGMALGETHSPYRSFVESDAVAAQNPQHEHKEGITSLN